MLSDECRGHRGRSDCRLSEPYDGRNPRRLRDSASRPANGRCQSSCTRDNFKIEACPINGPAIAASGKDVAIAWFTAPNEKQQSLVAFSHDGGRTFGKAAKVEDEGTLGRMQIALAPDGAAVVGWVEFANEKSTFKVRRIDAAGVRGQSVAVAAVSGTRFPRLAVAKNEAVLAWTESEKDSSRVKTARIALK